MCNRQFLDVFFSIKCRYFPNPGHAKVTSAFRLMVHIFCIQKHCFQKKWEAVAPLCAAPEIVLSDVNNRPASVIKNF